MLRVSAGERLCVRVFVWIFAYFLEAVLLFQDPRGDWTVGYAGQRVIRSIMWVCLSAWLCWSAWFEVYSSCKMCCCCVYEGWKGREALVIVTSSIVCRFNDNPFTFSPSVIYFFYFFHTIMNIFLKLPLGV